MECKDTNKRSQNQIITHFIWLLQRFCLYLQREMFNTRRMEIKKVTYEEALARFKRSLEIKRKAEKRMEEEWKAMGLTGTIVSL